MRTRNSNKSSLFALLTLTTVLTLHSTRAHAGEVSDGCRKFLLQNAACYDLEFRGRRLVLTDFSRNQLASSGEVGMGVREQLRDAEEMAAGLAALTGNKKPNSIGSDLLEQYCKETMAQPSRSSCTEQTELPSSDSPSDSLKNDPVQNSSIFGFDANTNEKQKFRAASVTCQSLDGLMAVTGALNSEKSESSIAYGGRRYELKNTKTEKDSSTREATMNAIREEGRVAADAQFADANIQISVAPNAEGSWKIAKHTPDELQLESRDTLVSFANLKAKKDRNLKDAPEVGKRAFCSIRFVLMQPNKGAAGTLNAVERTANTASLTSAGPQSKSKTAQ